MYTSKMKTKQIEMDHLKYKYNSYDLSALTVT